MQRKDALKRTIETVEFIVCFVWTHYTKHHETPAWGADRFKHVVRDDLLCKRLGKRDMGAQMCLEARYALASEDKPDFQRTEATAK